ncbi:hypothetical protein QJQ58_05690 [Paenibacillus dendritiformis]|uniref:hypothetical protein n=1 Tax=Paenibacillus dendritiformis TaxID=130049 RepID=UPI00248B474F|nr:hypothetical protein [Paenibacillus dendritiformis]WGU95758.1 hypothetical protein QJQ58_05690 [Paenibacillus dendritiformis]
MEFELNKCDGEKEPGVCAKLIEYAIKKSWKPFAMRISDNKPIIEELSLKE